MHSQADPSIAQRPARTEKLAFNARAVLEKLAKPRMTGSTGAAEVTAEIKSHLESLG